MAPYNNYISTQDRARQVLEAPVAPQVGLAHFVQDFGLMAEPKSLGIPPGVSYELTHTASQTTAMAEREGLAIRQMGYAPTFSGTRVYHGASTDWVTLNIEEDPLYYLNQRRLIVPRTVAHSLRRMDQAGIVFDAIFIAHEVPQGHLRTGQAIPLEYIMPPSPAAQTARLQTLGKLTTGFWKSIGQLIQGIGVTALASSAAIVAAPIALAAASGMDPILFGLHIDPQIRVNHGHLASWHYITHWYWDN